MTPYLIIDGYNLMHAAGIARTRYAPGALEACRTRLHRELAARLDADVLAAAVIVYDAFESVSNLDREQQHRGLNVLFAAQGRDADSLIERMLQRHSVPRRVIVVSSDHRLHKAARRRRARCVDSEDFWFELDPGGHSPLSPAVQKVENPVHPEANQQPVTSSDDKSLSNFTPNNNDRSVPIVRDEQQSLEAELERWAATIDLEEPAIEPQPTVAPQSPAPVKVNPAPVQPTPVKPAPPMRKLSADEKARSTSARRRAEAAQDPLDADIPGERAKFASEFDDQYLKQLYDDLQHDRLE